MLVGPALPAGPAGPAGPVGPTGQQDQPGPGPAGRPRRPPPRMVTGIRVGGARHCREPAGFSGSFHMSLILLGLILSVCRGGFRIPQVYPPAQAQIAMQIQRASASCGDQNQPRLAPRGSAPRAPNLPLRARFIFRRFIFPSQIATHHHGFQPDGCCRFIGGTVEIERMLRGCAFLRLCIGKRSESARR
jgi:hypothetical protein